MWDCKDVKAGDVVAVLTSGWNATIRRSVVERTTAAMVVVDGQKYNRRGNRRGVSYSGATYIEPWSKEHDKRLVEHRAEVKRRQCVRLIKKHEWSLSKDEDVTAVVALMRERGML